MTDKIKQKNTTKDQGDATHVFEVHTMAKDNELITQQSVKTVSKSLSQQQKQQKTTPVLKEKKEQPVNTTANPFLAKDGGKKDISTHSFALKKSRNVSEKINQTSADMTPKVEKNMEQKMDENIEPIKKPKKTLQIMMIFFIIVFLFGVIGFTVYFFFLSDKKTAGSDVRDIVVETPAEQELVFETEITDNTIGQTYATDLPNYISFDVESVTAAADIAQELLMIEKNMIIENVIVPISFIVTDVNNNPVSFHVFAMSAGMIIPQDVLTSLEENFEIYAYHDPSQGVRFGFVIDAKNVNTLQEALRAQELQLPNAFASILGDSVTDATTLTFNDSVYGAYAIRYVNLDPAEAYSVDYTTHDQKLLIGTSKGTMRSMIDVINQMKIPEQGDTTGFEY